MDLLTELGQDMVDLWLNYWPRYLIGIRNTVILAIVATALGCLIGFICGILNTIPYSKQDHVVKRFFVKLIRVIVRIYVEVFRGTPMVLQAVFIFYGLPYFTHSAVAFSGYAGIWTACIIVVSINTGAYMAEIVRGGIISIDRGQFEGAMSIGMTHAQTMFKVIIPQVMRNILPSVSNEFVINIKDTSVLNVIGVTELYYFAGIIKRQNFQTFQTYLVVCILYFILTFTVTRLLRWVERKLDGNENYTIFGSQTDVNAEIHITKEG